MPWKRALQLHRLLLDVSFLFAFTNQIIFKAKADPASSRHEKDVAAPRSGASDQLPKGASCIPGQPLCSSGPPTGPRGTTGPTRHGWGLATPPLLFVQKVTRVASSASCWESLGMAVGGRCFHSQEFESLPTLASLILFGQSYISGICQPEKAGTKLLNDGQPLYITWRKPATSLIWCVNCNGNRCQSASNDNPAISHYICPTIRYSIDIHYFPSSVFVHNSMPQKQHKLCGTTRGGK